MLPIARDYGINQYSVNIYPYSPTMMFFNNYSPWMSQYNYFSTFNNNLSSQNPVSYEAPSQTMESRKLSIQGYSVSEKQKFTLKIDSDPIRNNNDNIQQTLNCYNTHLKIQVQGADKTKNKNKNKNKLQVKNQFENQCQFNDESSYNLKRRKKSDRGKNKKIKKGPQNSNRNILPSIVQQILSYISKPTKSKQLCSKIFSKLLTDQSPQLQNKSTISRYYCFVKLIKDKQNHYVNDKTLEILNQVHTIGINLFGAEQQLLYLKIARILTKYFLIELCPFLIVRSKRIAEEKRIEHLSIRRSLLNMVSEPKY